MAPFGRNFLKAHLRNKAKDAEEIPGKEIQVWVCNEEKVVCGVNKHTTCADMVQALLDDHKTVPESKRLLHGEPDEFCLLERWKGFERALPPLTRILRLWNAWGDQKPYIQFVLVKTSDFVPASKGAKRASKSRSAKAKRWEQGPAQYAKTLPVERQKRLVKKAFRKLEKLRKEEIHEGSEEIDRMVRLIISQDHTIRQQVQSMRDMDMEIERIERQFLEDSSASLRLTDSPDSQSLTLSLSASQCEDQLQEYLYTSDGINQLELQLHRHRELISELSRDIDEELRKSAWMLENEEPAGAMAASPCLDPEDLSSSEVQELESLRNELEQSMQAGLCLHNQTQELEKELQQNSTTLQSRNWEYQQLVSQLSSLQLEECPGQPSSVCSKSQVKFNIPQQTVEKLRPCLSPTDVTDTDSDTGISSTHSQDSLSPCLDRLPPLDTDV
ncbi:ras association domain-containing protein 9 [Chanos chanos]|uniref:Ras association domain-containing protein 9 n=1 Tax=Chanos chanos TaxID=29144 RepID=A0A6J2WQW5_CHACN|nr:ras association domain-containing protein 9 [Chanos chanos]